MAKINDLYPFQTHIQFLCQFLNAFLITQQDGITDALGLGLDCSFEHVRMCAFSKHHTLRVAACCFVKLAGQFTLLPHEFTQMSAIGLPIGNGLASHPRLDSSLGHSHGNFCNQTWIDGFGDKIVTTKSEVVYMIGLVHHVRHRLFSQFGNGIHCCKFHFLIDGTSMRVKRSAENVGKAYDIVYLVWIVGTSRSYQHVWTRSHRIFIGNLRRRVCQCEDNRILGHAANHVLRQHIAF